MFLFFLGPVKYTSSGLWKMTLTGREWGHWTLRCEKTDFSGIEDGLFFLLTSSSLFPFYKFLKFFLFLVLKAECAFIVKGFS